MRGIPLSCLAALVAAPAIACEEDEPVDSGPDPFAVVNVDPPDGEAMGSPIQAVQLILNADPDLATCTTSSVRVDGLADDGSVGFPVEIAFDLQGDGNLRLQPADPWLGPHRYAVTMRGGAGGCTDTTGREIVPFHSTFEVP